MAGVVHVTAFNPYLRPLPADFDADAAALRKRYGLPPTSKHGPIGAEEGIDVLPAEKLASFMNEFRTLMPRAALSDYVDNIDYLVKRIGVDHVGIGTDFNHGAGIAGFNDEGQAPNVTRGVGAAGIFGGTDPEDMGWQFFAGVSQGRGGSRQTSHPWTRRELCGGSVTRAEPRGRPRRLSSSASTASSW